MAEYVEYMERQYTDIQQSNVKRTDAQGKYIPIAPCPVLYLTPETNAQGKQVYRQNPDPNPRWSASANGVRPFNSYSVGGKNADATHYITGTQFPSNPMISDNPMDTNWGGVIYTQQMIDSGKYDRRTVGKPVTGAGSDVSDLPTV